MNAVLGMEFMQNALLAGLLASLACGVIGSLVVVNRQVFMAGGVAHTAYGGVGLAFFLGLPVLPCAVGFTVLAALIMALASFGRSERSDGIIGIMWAAGMAFGIILMDLTPGYNVDLMSYLFGSLLAVPRSDIWFMLLLDAIILAVVLFWYKDFLSLSFDMEFARSMGVPVRPLYALMQVLTAVTVIMVIQVAGSGGSYPIDVLPEVFQKLYVLMPFHYGMDMLRETIAGRYENVYWTNLAVMAGMCVLFAALGMLLYYPARPLNRLIARSKEKSGIM